MSVENQLGVIKWLLIVILLVLGFAFQPELTLLLLVLWIALWFVWWVLVSIFRIIGLLFGAREEHTVRVEPSLIGMDNYAQVQSKNSNRGNGLHWFGLLVRIIALTLLVAGAIVYQPIWLPYVIAWIPTGWLP
jgi:hypothetical protein